MAAQTQTRAPATAPTLTPERSRETARLTGSNADAQARAGTGDPATPQGPAKDPRAAATEAYANRLWEVVGDLMLEEDVKVQGQRARAVMGEAAEVDMRLRGGDIVDVAHLPKFPEGDEGAMPIGALPPSWVQPARILLQMAGGSGATPRNDSSNAPATDLWGTAQTEPATPWAGALDDLRKIGRKPADYGVPGYQTQSNNLASPEATCNGTSLAMVLERLGYSREDLILAIETKLKRAELQASLAAKKLPPDEVKRQMAAFDPTCVRLKDGAWKARVLQYLRAENGPRHDKDYQRLRGARQSDTQLQTWAGDFQANAGMDDLALFMMDLLGIERTAINAGSNASDLVGAVHDGSSAHGLPKPTTERVEPGIGWPKAKVKLKDCLEQGGAAMMSIRHKGAGQEGTHIVAVQAVTSGGLVVDDPYGKARPDYSAAKPGDAYADPGKTRATSGRRNQKDPALDDWKMSAPVTSAETRGEASDWTDAMVSTSWVYLMLVHRGVSAGSPPT